MTDRVQLRHSYAEPPERIREVLTDPEYLRARLREVGGPGAELVSREQDEAGGVTVVQRQTVPSDWVPDFARSLFSGDVVIERTESWNGSDGGTVRAVVAGTPARISGTMALGPHDGGTELTMRIEARVSIPLFGGTVEKMVTDNIARLMETEYRFTLRWLHDGAE
jgi:carbon monoxide dehydrogenase subunit G